MIAATADATQAYRLSWEKQRTQTPTGAAPVRTLEEAQPRAVVSALRTGNGPAPSLDARTSVWIAGVAALLLIITVANVANLVLGRTLERHRDTAVRLALGVSRRRLMAHLLTESALLAVLGAIGAVIVTYITGSTVFAVLTTTTGSPAGLLDSRTLLLTAGITVVVAMATGVIPAWLASRTSVAQPFGRAHDRSEGAVVFARRWSSRKPRCHWC